MQLGLRVHAAILWTAAAILTPSLADEVVLRTGGVLEGKAFHENGQVRIELETGSIVVPESAVERIVPGPAPADVKAAERTARLQHVTERIASVGLDDAQGLYRIAGDARLAGHPEDEVRSVLGLVLGADPNHAGAREDLGETLYDGRWRPQEEARWLEERRRAADMRERGFVQVDGVWVTRAEADWDEREAEWAELADALEAELDGAAAESSDLAQRLAATEQELAAARAEALMLEDEVHGLECRVADLENRVGHLDGELGACLAELAAVPECDSD
jgi:hypothetical protein